MDERKKIRTLKNVLLPTWITVGNPMLQKQQKRNKL